MRKRKYNNNVLAVMIRTLYDDLEMACVTQHICYAVCSLSAGGSKSHNCYSVPFQTVLHLSDVNIVYEIMLQSIFNCFSKRNVHMASDTIFFPFFFFAVFLL